MNKNQAPAGLSVDRNPVRQQFPARDGQQAVFHSREAVLASLVDNFSLVESNEDRDRGGLRRPQVGAVHAILADWTTGSSEPITIVMPTGTGKTETMLAVTAAVRPDLLLVLVPSNALREQIAKKFETWGILKDLGCLNSQVHHLAVGQIRHAFLSQEKATHFAKSCNVIITTPNALNASTPETKMTLLKECSHLFVDEAHHIAARTWRETCDTFVGKPIVQFTATPFREDGRHLGGRLAYNFPLREAQNDGYFASINYRSIVAFLDPDRAIALEAVKHLRRDVRNGLDHLLMARTKRIGRVREILHLYEEIAPEFYPVVLHSGLRVAERREALRVIDDRTSRIILCVDMLGEGFDLPALKVAAIHDPHKSLGVTLQFIGRFARPTEGPASEATVVVGRPEGSYDVNLSGLYAEDADWNLLIRDLSESAVEEQEKLSEFEQGFQAISDTVSIRNLLPKMSAVAYRTECTNWKPNKARELFGRLLTEEIIINQAEAVAWFVSENRTPVRWGHLRTVEELSYDLYVLYWDDQQQILYINSSTTKSLHEKLAKAVCGESATRITGEKVYRLLAEVKRLVPTNVGVLDVRNASRRFSMHVGADVTEGFPVAEAQTKTKTNIFAYGFENGIKVSFGASLKGRIWSYRVAGNLSEWVDWCRAAGQKLVDDSIDIDSVFEHFIRPEVVESRPNLVPLGIEWPWNIHLRPTESLELHYENSTWPLIDADLELTSFSVSDPISFDVVTPQWRAPYVVTFPGDRISYIPTGTDVLVQRADSNTPLSEFLQDRGLTLLFEQDAVVVPPGLLLKPNRELPPYDPEELTVVDWTGVNLQVESQGADKKPDSIQRRTIEHIRSIAAWDVVVDDDGPGEIADIVAIRVDGRELKICLVHCKYSSRDFPGARIDDLYDVCGQAQKSVRARRSVPSFFRNLIRREKRRYARVGRSGFEIGHAQKLYELEDSARLLKPSLKIMIAQPGLSKSKVSQPQLELLASTSVYLHETFNAAFEVLCSP